MESRRYNTAGIIGAEKAAVQTGAEGIFQNLILLVIEAVLFHLFLTKFECWQKETLTSGKKVDSCHENSAKKLWQINSIMGNHSI